MTYLKLNNDVYIVGGYTRICIYDLKHQNLYSISQDTRDFIIDLLENKQSSDPPPNSKKELFDYLIKEKILILSNKKHSTPSIQSLKKDFGITFAWIEVTQRCNLKCTFCYEESSPHALKRMSLKDFRLVIDRLKQANIKRIQLIGGEPLVLKNDLKEMIQLARKEFDFIEVFTNGTLLNEDWCQFFKDNKIHVAISIQSYIPEEHDKIVNQAGSHTKTVHGLKLLQKYRIKYRIATIATTNCEVGEKQENTSYRLKPSCLRVTGRALLSLYDFELFKNRAITKKTFAYPLNTERVIKSISGHQCFISKLYIDTDLNVYPCVMERRMSNGNLKKDALENILNHKVRFLTKDHIDGCKDCEYRYACFDCRPDSNGRGVYEKPWYCSYDPYNGTWQDLETTYQNLQVTGISRALFNLMSTRLRIG